MADWENIECGYNAWEETMNFGTRCLGGLEDLHETSTLAVIQNTDGATTTLPTIHSLINNGSVFFSINKSLRSFQDLHCTVLSLNMTYDDIIDTFSISLNGTLLCVCLRNGVVNVFDIETAQIVFQKIVCENNDKEQAFFIKSIPVQTATENLTFYILNRIGKIHRIRQSCLEDTSSDDKYTDHIVMDLSKPILNADLLYPIMCCTNLEHVFICNLEMAKFTSFSTKGLKKIYLCNTRFCLGLTDDGRFVSVCTKTGLRLTTNIKLLFDDMLLIYGNNHMQILAVTKKDEIGSSHITLISYTEYKTIFSLKLSGEIHFIIPEHIHDEIMYISEIRTGEAIKELRFQIISETAPEYRLQRLLRRQKFNEAEQFSKMFSLDLTEIQKAKAQLIVDKYECNETDVSELLEILNGISDYEFKMLCCFNTHSSCTNLNDVERVLRYMNSVSPSELSADSEKWEIIGPELMFRFHTFLMLVNAGYLKNSFKDWNNFSTCDLLIQLRILLEESQIEEFKILYNRLDAETAEKLTQTDIATILDNVNKLALENQESFLNAFVPLSISYLPLSVTTFIQWIISNVYYIEKTDFDAFPKNALTFLNQMVVLLNLDSIHQLDFQQCSMIDSDLLQELENIIDTLKKLEVLKTEHRIVIPLQHLQKDMKTLFPGLLISFAKNETFLTQFIENFVRPHQNDVFEDIIEDLVKCPEEYWIKVIPIMLKYMTSLTKHLNAVITVIKEARIPWCEEIRKIASNSIGHNHPLVCQIIEKIQQERKSSILRKKPYCIMKPYENTSKFILFAINRILYCNESSMVHDIYEICKDSVTTTLEADVLIIHHLIKKGDFCNALEVLDRNSEEYVSKLCRRLVTHASTAIDNEYKLDSIQENYYQILGSIFVRLQKNETSFKKQYHCNTLQLLRNVYHIQRSYKVNVICQDFIKPVETHLLGKLIPVLTEDYNNNKNTVFCISRCVKIAEYLKLDSKVVLIELCRHIIGDYNIIISAGQVLYKNEDDPKSLCAMATLLLLGIGIPNSRFEISDANRWCDYEHIDLKPFTVGLRLARKLMVKAILSASEGNLIRCMEVANWMEMTYFVSYPEIHNESLHNVCISNAMSASLSLFNGIKTVFKFYLQHLDMTKNCHISNLYIGTNGDNGKLQGDSAIDVSSLHSSITSLSVEGNGYMAYKLIEVLHRNLICIKDSDAELSDNLHEVLQNCAKRLLHQMFSSASINIDFAFNLLIILNDVTYSKRFLVQSLKQYKRNFVKFEKIARVSLRFLKHYNVEDGQLLCGNILCLSKWWKRLNNCCIPYEEFFRRSPREILSKLIKLKCLDTKMINTFCFDGNFDVDQHYQLYLESLLLNWEPRYTICVNGTGAVRLAMEHNKDEFFEMCLEVIQLIDSVDVVLDLLKTLWEKVNFYHYEVFYCIMDLLSFLGASSDNKEKRSVLSFLYSYNRVSKPGETEVEQWFTLYPDTQSIAALSQWRLPFTPTLLTNKIWSIIRPEVNLKTYTHWFKAIRILLNLNQDDICSYVVKDVISSGVFVNNNVEEWLIHAKHEELLQEIDICMQNISNYELATATLYSLIPNIPKGADKVNAAALCYKYACKYLEQYPNSVDVQKAVVKVHKKYIHFSIIHILHVNNLADKKYLDIIGLPIEDFIKTLYMDDRILKKRELINVYCPDINKAVEELAVLHNINIQEKRLELLNNWLSVPLLSVPFSIKSDTSFQMNSLHEFNNKPEHLIRASYLCTSGNLPDWQSYLLEVGNVEVTESKNLGFKAMALKCFCNISTIKDIERLTGSTYNEYRNFINKLSLISSLEHFGFYFTIDALDKHNKVELLNRLSYHMNSIMSLKIVASVCVTYTIYEAKYWATIVRGMVKLEMFQELKESLTFLKKKVVMYNLQWYIDAWQFVVNYTLKSTLQIDQGTVRKQCIDSCIVIQACPVLFSLNFEPIIGKFLELKQYEFVVLLLQYLKEEDQDRYIKVLHDVNINIGDKFRELVSLGFVGSAHVQNILSKFHNGSDLKEVD